MKRDEKLIEETRDRPGIISNLEIYLCPQIRNIVKKLPRDFKIGLEEIRLRINKPLMVFGKQKDYFVDIDGGLNLRPCNSYLVGRESIDKTLQFASNYSIYSIEEELKNGYITIAGGHRIGIVGKVLLDRKGVRSIRDFSGLNIRVSREKIGIASKVLPYIISPDGEFLNTLLVSPPQCGKTTLLRDIIRTISEGVGYLNFRGLKVGVVDERSELAACFQGIAQNNLGPRTDVLDSCPKAEGIIMLIRAMSPQVIATDEIGRTEDSLAIREAIMAGIKLITTVHGRSLQNILGKNIVGGLVREGIFERIIFLSNSNGVGTIDSVVDGLRLEYLYKKINNRQVV